MSDEEIQAAVDMMNGLADELVENMGAEGAATALVKTSAIFHYHKPWDTAFMVLIEGNPAHVVSEARDAWFVDLLAGRRLDLEKGGADPPVTGYYRPEGHDGPALELEWHPVEGEEYLWRAVSADGKPLPRIELGMLSFSDRHPMTKEELAEMEAEDA